MSHETTFEKRYLNVHSLPNKSNIEFEKRWSFEMSLVSKQAKNVPGNNKCPQSEKDVVVL